MEITKQFPAELFVRDDAVGLQEVLTEWKQPKLGTLLELLDLAAEKPHTTACLLQYIHAKFPPETIAAGRKCRQKKQLGLLEWEEEDWSECFYWESAGRNCRILAYLGQDEEVLIPEEISGQPVAEVAQRFFLQDGTIRRLLVPEGIQLGTILPREARELFGRSFDTPEVFRLERKLPRPHLETPAAVLPSGEIRPGQTVEFGRYARAGDESENPIPWRVLRREQDRVLLLAAQVLDCLPYHHSRNAVLWPDCGLRNWLNSVFFSAAFTPEEQARILPTVCSGQPNPVFRTRDASRSQDRVFLLSPGQWQEYEIQTEGGPVWLRMPGLNTQYAVTLEKNIDYQGRLVNDGAVGILPAVWVRV